MLLVEETAPAQGALPVAALKAYLRMGTGFEPVADATEDAALAGAEEAEKKIAVVVKLQLGSSQYATMALRELMKAGGVKAFKPEYGGR